MPRKLLIAVIFLLLCLRAMAQDTLHSRKLCYVSIGANAGSLYGPRVCLSVMLGQKHELSLGGDGYFRESNNYPSDFDCQSCKHGLARESIVGITLGYGYIIRPRLWTKRLRAVLRGDILLGSGGMPDNFQRIANPSPGDDNYKHEFKSSFAAALLLRPALDLALGRYCGLSLGPFGIFSKDFNGGGASINVLLGRVMNKRCAEDMR